MVLNIKNHLYKALNSDEILSLTSDKKVYFIHANNPNPPYIEYEVISERGVEFSEGKERYTTYLVQVDIFSKTDYTELETKVRSIMIEQGYIRDNAADLYEDKTGLYHKAMRFNISLPY